MNTNEKDNPIKKLALDPFDIERLYGLSRGSLANMRTKRVGPPYFKVGRKVFYRPGPFERWFFQTPVKTRDGIDVA